MTLLATAARPIAQNKETQATLQHQAVPAPAPHDIPPVLLEPAAARKLQASTPTFDRDLEDRSKAVTNPLLQSAYKRFEADQAADGVIVGTPFRRLLASTPTFDRDLEDRSKAVTNPTLEAAYKTFEAAAATGAAPGEALPFRRLLSDRDRQFKETERQDHAALLTANPLLEEAYEHFAAAALPFRRLLSRDHTSDRELEDRSRAVANPTLAAAVKSLEADARPDALPFRRLLARDDTSDRELEDRSALTTNPTLAAAVKSLQADARPDPLPFRRLLVRDHTSDRELEDRSRAVTNPLLQSAYKKF
uniref:Uncharacterized protein n=1 Tax=Tetradesmus obliquus TaxID=3088 RepID=A0A383VKM0_TETOB